MELCGAQEYLKQDQMFVTVHDAVLSAVNKQKRLPVVSILRNVSFRRHTCRATVSSRFQRTIIFAIHQVNVNLIETQFYVLDNTAS